MENNSFVTDEKTSFSSSRKEVLNQTCKDGLSSSIDYDKRAAVSTDPKIKESPQLSSIVQTSLTSEQVSAEAISGIGSHQRCVAASSTAHKAERFPGVTSVLGVEFGSLIHGDRLDSQWEKEEGLKEQFFGLFHATDNKLGLKLFGTRTLLARERIRQKRKHWWIIHPCSNFRLFWDCVMLLIVTTNLIVLPVSIAYFYHHHGVEYLAFNIFCDIVFFLDILINFRTGFIASTSKRKVVLNGKAIALKYAKSWFAIDLLSSLPLDYPFLYHTETFEDGEALRMMRILKVFQFLRYLRVSRLVKYLHLRLEYHNTANTWVSIIRVFLVLIFVAHNTNCMMYLVAVIGHYPADSWIILDKIKDLHWFDQYARGLFKAFTLMLSCGYGQNSPMSFDDSWAVLWAMMIGVISYALFVSYTGAVLQSIDSSGREFSDNLQQVSQYMRYRRLPDKLQKRVVHYFQHRYNGKSFDEPSILNELSRSRRKDLIRFNCSKLIKNVPFFINADATFVDYVLSKLVFEMFQPGDVIIQVKSRGDKMYFIQEGSVDILTEEGLLVTRLPSGSFFGEIALLTNGKRCATVRAGSSYCNLFSLHKEELEKMMKIYPRMKQILENIATRRLSSLGKDHSVLNFRSSQTHCLPKSGGSKVDLESRSSNAPGMTQLQRVATAIKEFFIDDTERYQAEKLNPLGQHRSLQNLHNVTFGLGDDERADKIAELNQKTVDLGAFLRSREEKRTSVEHLFND